MNRVKNYFITAIGLFVLALGLYLVKTLDSPKEFLIALPYVCIGVGCGIFGHGMGNLIANKALQNNPSIQKQIEIEKNDERNVAISNRAKAKAYDIMTFVFGALMVSFALMGVDIVPTLLLVFAYLFVQGYAIYYRCKYDKEM